MSDAKSLEVLSCSLSGALTVGAVKRAVKGMRFGSPPYVDAVSRMVRKAMSPIPKVRRNGEAALFNGMFYGIVLEADARLCIESALEKAGVVASSWRAVSEISIGVLFSCPEAVPGPTSLVCFPNGVADLHRGALMPFSPEHMVFSCMDYPYDPTASCPLWRDFLHRVIPDAASRDVLRMFFGAVWADRKRVKIEKTLFLYGSGANGKSVVFETLTGVAGKANCSNFGFKRLTRSSPSEIERCLAEINGKRLNYCPDMDEADLSSGTAKSLISGEPAQARRLYGQYFTASEIPLLMANVNKLPPAPPGEASERRRLVVHFPVTIPKEERDTELPAKLRDEYPGILNWSLTGLHDLQASGWRFPDLTASGTPAERDPLAGLAAFIASAGLRPAPHASSEDPVTLPLKRLHEDYMLYQGLTQEGLSQLRFTMALTRHHGFTMRKVNGYNHIDTYGPANAYAKETR